jgi:alpha-ketoglutarate-dependent taurine dioxygenase
LARAQAITPTEANDSPPELSKNVPMTLSFRTMPGPLGAAELTGLDIARDAADADARGRMRDALATHGVLCVRQPAPLDDDGMRALVRMIGPIKDPIARTRDGGMIRYSEERQIIDAGFVLTDEMRKQRGDLSVGGDDLRPGLFQFFHTDDSYTEAPSSATVLHARQLPKSGGGDTCFIDMRAAYATLDEAERRRLIGLMANHAYNNRGAFPPRPPAKGPLEAMVDVAHPVVRAHPVTGTPALYFDLDRATHVEGMPEAEGRVLLQSLQDHAENNAPRYGHVWQANDVLIWDNVAVQHRASGDFPVGESRRFWRYMVEGTTPKPAREP